MNKKRKIKKLAKKCLRDKWYPIRDGAYIGKNEDCAFCKDAEERVGIGNSCTVCYIPKISTPDICNMVGRRSTETIIALLEQLAEYGRLLD